MNRFGMPVGAMLPDCIVVGVSLKNSSAHLSTATLSISSECEGSLGGRETIAIIGPDSAKGFAESHQRLPGMSLPQC